MRKSKTEKTEANILDAIDASLYTNNPDDCFGNEWDPQHRDCSICADVELCGIIYNERHIRPKKVKFDSETKPLDLSDFASVKWTSITKLIRSYQREGDPMTLNELEELVAHQSKMKDPDTVREYIRRMIPEYNLTIDGNTIRQN